LPPRSSFTAAGRRSKRNRPSRVLPNSTKTIVRDPRRRRALRRIGMCRRR
jgi:hypothetical protein